MTRIVPVAVVLLLAAAGAVFAGAGHGDETPRYRVVLDNAFGLTEGADLRADGVKVGQVEKLEVQSRTARAVATVAVTRASFAGFRRDVFCVVEPQSLIGEYFLDCEPGKARERLPDGATVPVERTAGTIPADVVNNILRRPYRERLGILLAELGTAFAARGDDVNETIARAVPALRETNRVLRILADERETLRQLTRDADTVIGRLADGKEGVSRFVAEARDAAAASADRREDLATNIRLLPDFQRELQPTLALLGRAAREQTPALADLRAAAPELRRLIDRLGPFSDASRPAVRSLARTARTGRRAVRAARPTVRQLRRTAARSEDPFGNLRFILEHIDNRDFAVEPNPTSPGNKGFTGLEALLQYPFVQSQAINIFDVKGYILKLNALFNECSQYTDARARLADPGRAKRCNADLGNGAPSLEEAAKKEEEFARGGNPSDDDASKARRTRPSGSAAAGDDRAGGPGADATTAPRSSGSRLELPGLPPIELPELPDVAPGVKKGGGGEPLLDLLLRP